MPLRKGQHAHTSSSFLSSAQLKTQAQKSGQQPKSHPHCIPLLHIPGFILPSNTRIQLPFCHELGDWDP